MVRVTVSLNPKPLTLSNRQTLTLSNPQILKPENLQTRNPSIPQILIEPETPIPRPARRQEHAKWCKVRAGEEGVPPQPPTPRPSTLTFGIAGPPREESGEGFRG